MYKCWSEATPEVIKVASAKLASIYNTFSLLDPRKNSLSLQSSSILDSSLKSQSPSPKRQPVPRGESLISLYSACFQQQRPKLPSLSIHTEGEEVHIIYLKPLA